MKNILLLVTLSLIFNACGNSRSSESNAKESIAITAKCNDEGDTELYHPLESDDEIVKTLESLNDSSSQSEAEIEIVLNQDGINSVCIVSGTAVILR